MKACFFKYFPHQMLQFFSFLQKNIQFRWKRYSNGISFDTPSRPVFLPSAILIKFKFFPKEISKKLGFIKKKQISYVWRNLAISIAFYIKIPSFIDFEEKVRKKPF